MSKKKKQKYYAIKEGKGVKNKIVRTWSECKELLLGYPSIYLSLIHIQMCIRDRYGRLATTEDIIAPALPRAIELVDKRRENSMRFR